MAVCPARNTTLPEPTTAWEKPLGVGELRRVHVLEAHDWTPPPSTSMAMACPLRSAFVRDRGTRHRRPPPGRMSLPLGCFASSTARTSSRGQAGPVHDPGNGPVRHRRVDVPRAHGVDRDAGRGQLGGRAAHDGRGCRACSRYRRWRTARRPWRRSMRRPRCDRGRARACPGRLGGCTGRGPWGSRRASRPTGSSVVLARGAEVAAPALATRTSTPPQASSTVENTRSMASVEVMSAGSTRVSPSHRSAASRSWSSLRAVSATR